MNTTSESANVKNGGDNRYYNYGCPALMQDGRFITNYQESRVFEQTIRNINKIESAQEYRHFLQNNAETIISRERQFMESANTCPVNGKCLTVAAKSNCNVGMCG